MARVEPLPELPLILLDDAPPSAETAPSELPRASSHRWSLPRWAVVLVALAAGTVGGLVGGTVATTRGDAAGPLPPVTILVPSPELGVERDGDGPQFSPVPTSARTVGSDFQLLDGHRELHDLVVITPFPSGDNAAQPVWFVDRDGVSSQGVEPYPGDWPYPFVMLGDALHYPSSANGYSTISRDRRDERGGYGVGHLASAGQTGVAFRVVPDGAVPLYGPVSSAGPGPLAPLPEGVTTVLAPAREPRGADGRRARPGLLDPGHRRIASPRP